MKKCIKNAVCVSMTILLLGSGLVGCSRETPKGEVKMVEDDGKPFYDSELIYFETPDLKDLKGADTYGTMPILIGDKFYQSIDYYVNDPNNFSMGHLLMIYDENGKIIEQKDLAKTEAFKNLGGDYGFNSSSAIHLDGKNLVNSFDEQTGKQTCYIYDYVDDSLEKFEMIDLSFSGYISGMCQLSDGTYVVQYTSYNGDNEENKLIFGDGKKITNEIDLLKEFKDKEIFYFGEMRVSSDGFKLSGYTGAEEYDIYYKESTGELSCEKSDGNLYTSSWSVTIDDKIYTYDETGIYIDGQEEPVLLMEDGNIAPNRVVDSDLVSVSDDGFLFAGTEYVGNSDRSYILKIKKLDKNPNIGKELLTLSTLSWSDRTIEDAVVKFNKESDKYYIKMDLDRYTLDYGKIYEEVDLKSDDANIKVTQAYNTHQAELVNQLAMDLLAGDAPDIMLGCAKYSQLMKDSYLLDLNKFINKDLGSDKFYQNIIDGATYDGKTFVVPLTFHMVGIMAKPDDVKGKVGFNYDEYVDFVKGPCNGKDPFYTSGMNKIDILQQLFANEAELFIKDGKIDVDNDEFRDLAKFVKDNCEDPSGDEEEEYTDMGNTDPSYAYINGFDSYIRTATGYGSWTEPYALCGFPSEDGRGAIVTFDLDIGVSAQTGSPDGAKEFIKSVIASDSLAGIAFSSSSEAINKDTSRTVAKDSLVSVNQMVAFGPNPKKYEEEDIEKYIKVIETCRVQPACDPAILNIIAEEIPAYFADQKDISEVCKSINNRAQTVLDEKS